MNAGLVGMVVIAVLSSILLSITEKRERWLRVAACSLAGTALYVVVGHLVSIGFAFFRLGPIGSRTFVAFGVYQACLMLCVVLLLRRREKLLRGGATALVVVFLAVVVSNIGRSGRMAIDQRARLQLQGMEAWPGAGAVKFVNGTFIVRLADS